MKTAHPEIDEPYYGASYFEAMKRFFLKYATFDGRASRSEYWWWFLTDSVVLTVLLVTRGMATGSWGWSLVPGTIGVFDDIPSMIRSAFTVVTVVPSIAVTWRRLHDTGRSGAWIFLVLIPVVGTIALIILTALPPVSQEDVSTPSEPDAKESLRPPQPPTPRNRSTA